MAISPEELTREVNPIKEALARKRIEELRALAKEHGVGISGLDQKKDIVDILARHPGIARDLGLTPSLSSEIPSLDEILKDGGSSSLQDKTPAPAPHPTVKRESPGWETTRFEGPAGRSLDDMLQESLATTVDFSRTQSLLGEAGTRFQARNYDAVISLAKDCVMGIDEVTKRYLRGAWAYAISASLKILEDSDAGSDPYRRADEALAETKRSFQGQSYLTDSRVLEKLNRSLTDLYSYEIQKARQHIKSQEAVLDQIQTMGGDTSRAIEVLGKATEALLANDRSRYMEIITKADDLVTQARNTRISEIRAALTSVESVVKEAKGIGADVTEALQLHEQARGSIQNQDFVNANRLIQKTERVALEAQKNQIDRVMELQRRQLEKVKKLIMDTKPLLEKARAKGMDTSKAMDLLRQAVDCANRGDYVGGLLHAKEAADGVRGVVPAEEMPREAIPAPPI